MIVICVLLLFLYYFYVKVHVLLIIKRKSKGSNCINAKDALKTAASLGPYECLYWAGARMYVICTQCSKGVEQCLQNIQC